MSKCKACGAEIIWIRSSKSGKMIPCDPVPVPFKLKIGRGEPFVLPDGDVICGERTETQEEAWGSGYISHFATCPCPAQHRMK